MYLNELDEKINYKLFIKKNKKLHEKSYEKNE